MPKPFDIDTELDKYNAKLHRVKMRRRGNRISLNATFPPKSGEIRAKQRDLSLGISATAIGCKEAFLIAQEISSQLQRNVFDWSKWERHREKMPDTVATWIKRLEKYYYENTTSSKPEENWRLAYKSFLDKLPQDKPLTVKVLEDFVIAAPPKTAIRKERAEVAMRLARIAGLQCDLKPLAKGYSPKPIELPSDDIILQTQELLNSEAYLWVYRMMACYGLRDHEVFRLDLNSISPDNPAIRVLENTKTKQSRLVYPFPKQWWEQWQLWEYNIPSVNIERTNISLGDSVGTQFRRSKIPFRPYALRHAYAIRTAVTGLDPTIAAKYMGHSVELHVKTYHRWIQEFSLREAYERLQG